MYEQFMASFEEPSKTGKTFVKGSTFNPDAGGEGGRGTAAGSVWAWHHRGGRGTAAGSVWAWLQRTCSVKLLWQCCVPTSRQWSL